MNHTEKETQLLESIRQSLDELRKPLLPAAEQLGYPDDLITAICVVSALNLIGRPARLVTGSAQWLVMSDERQGEAILTGQKAVGYFGYNFDVIPSLPELVKGIYPESAHSWVVNEDGEIFDFTMDSQVEALQELASQPWPAETRPPSIIYGSPDDLLCSGWFYEADPNTALPMHCIVQHLINTTHRLRAFPQS